MAVCTDESDVKAATTLLHQCRKAHQDLMKCARDEEVLLSRLCFQLQQMQETDPTAANPISRGVVGQKPVVKAEESLQASRHADDRCVDLPRDLPEVESRASHGSSESRRRASLRELKEKGLDRIPSESAQPQYAIVGISGAGRPVVRNGLINMLRSNFSSSKEEYRWWCSSMLAQCLLSMTVLLERLWSLEEPERKGCLAKFVSSTVFGILSTAVILLNACFILYTTDLEMQSIDQPLVEMDANVKLIELLLASVYVLEVILKLAVHKLYYFWNSEMAWNLFDFMLVVFSIFENLLVHGLLPGQQVSSDAASSVNLGFLRLIRLCKIVKILRVFRTLKFFSELRLMLDCVLGSLMNVMWCVILLVFVMYVFGLLLQQGIVQYFMEENVTPKAEGELRDYFRSVGDTIITLFQSSTSGVDWNEPYQALKNTGQLLPNLYLAYVAFVFISVWNIVTSTFVEKALKLAQPDVDMLILEQQLQDFEDCKMLSKLFQNMGPKDDDGSGRIGIKEFGRLVETYEFRSYLQTKGIDIKNAETFFKMLVELQGENTLDAGTFANACVRMKGAATSIDLQTVMFTTHLMNKEQRKFFQSLHGRLSTIESILLEEPCVSRGPNGILPSGPSAQMPAREDTSSWHRL
ncbi:Scn10a [Symbiodinium necroappetens]|uniref:Scn10a protein n=1 Tax=Symbiodinium necroappetens TaxID=1628268 RepID=A0A812SJL2_9DINO|nr:Scn10a [Symbiodinium necroappetens]